MGRFFLFVFVIGALVSVLMFAWFGGPVVLLHRPAIQLIVLISAVLVLVSFVFGLLSGDYSWVDRLWSTAPVLYGWVYVATVSASGNGSPALLLCAVLITLWGARLTFNFARRGGYSGHEDYRWAILRMRIPNPIAWQAFHLLFICAFQIGLFVLFTAPLSRLTGESEVSPIALLPVAAMLGFLVLETIADQQQWLFQRAKHAAAQRHEMVGTAADQGEISSGFLRSGLFSLVRHPNYLGELGFWWGLYGYVALVSGSFTHWSLIGPVLLTLLFIGSTRFTESISCSKYPAYREYQRQTPAIFPLHLWPSLPAEANTYIDTVQYADAEDEGNGKREA